MSAEIISKVVQILRSQDYGVKDLKAAEVVKNISEPKDEVSLTEEAETYVVQAATQTEFEKEQFLKVERLKSMVRTKTYHMNEEMMDDIAKKIAQIFT